MEEKTQKPRKEVYSCFVGIELRTGRFAYVTDGMNVSFTVTDSPLKEHLIKPTLPV